MKTIIHVNQQIIAHNRKTGDAKNPIIIRNYKGSVTASEIKIRGPSKIVHSPHNPLKCGARVWIETEADVVIL